MKLTLEIDTEDPLDLASARELLNWRKFLGALEDMDQYLRSRVKYEDNEAAIEIRKELHDILNTNGVALHGDEEMWVLNED